MAVRNESAPTVFATQVTVLIRAFTMPTMVVAINDHAAFCGCFRKACVATGVFAESMQNLHDPDRSFIRLPFLQVNLMTVCSFQ